MKRFLPLLIASLGLSFGQVSAQYIVDDACATPFEDISGTGTALGLVDDGETNVTLPFDFTLYDITSTDVRIGNNGGMIFNATTGDLFALNDPLPTVDWTSGIVAFWDDLDNETGDVYIETRGTAPFRRFIVQWHMRPHFNNIGDATLQAILYESTNQIRFVYDDIDFGDPAFNDGVSATIGLQKDGTTADQYSFNSSIAGVNCILFSPPITAVCQDVTVQLDATGNYTFDTPLTPQVDAEQLIPAGSTTDFVQLQTFTATQGGLLHSVSVQLAGAYSSGQLWVDLWDGDLIAGTVPQLSNTVVTSAVPPGLTEFIIDAPVEVVAGNTYTWVLYDATSTTGVNLSKNDGNLYAGGYNQTSLTSDFVFRTKILQRPEIDNGTTDSDGLQSFGLSQTSFTCADAGLTVPVTLTVTDNLGNSGACVANVTVEDNEFPVANCQNANAFLDATGNATITASAVNNGSTDNCSGLTFSASQTTFSCGDVGVVPVTLTVSDASGNTDNCSANVNVTDGLAPNALCQNHTLILDGSGSGTLVVANVNNGSTDNCGIDSYSLSQTAFNCSNIGANTVTLTVEDLNGNTSSCNATVTVEDNQAPVVNCPANIVVCADDASGAVVTYPAVTGSDNCTYVITQTDVTGLTSGSNFPLGVTTLTYTNTDSPAGNSTSCSFDITVNPTPVADYTHSAACEGEATFFTDESTIDASSSITNWQWDMGDGSSPIGLVDPIHAFADTGSYDVELVVTSAEGCTDTTTQSVYVGLVPSASFTVANGCEGQPTSFTNTSSIGAGTLTYAWDFGDSNTSTDQDPSHTYALDGTYTVTLTVTSDNGCEDTFTGSVEVYDSPTALFTASTACFGTATSFTNLSTGGGTPTYAWDFGDSNTSTSTNPTNQFAVDGTFDVTLIATTDHNCQDTETQTVTVYPLPVAAFTNTTVCGLITMDFTDQSAITSGSVTGWQWYFGDGNLSQIQNATHVFAAGGTYTTSLVVTSALGCQDSISQNVTVLPKPVVDFSWLDACLNDPNTFTDETTISGSTLTGWDWDFGDNSGTSTQQNPSYIYSTSGTYDVELIATTADGCK
ncbi:MAG: PKD domain-containing protein, partial [Flavobacteriales bacterium]|nr:PKD domain-containing protein [Flavobacteriales bacterium]